MEHRHEKIHIKHEKNVSMSVFMTNIRQSYHVILVYSVLRDKNWVNKYKCLQGGIWEFVIVICNNYEKGEAMCKQY